VPRLLHVANGTSVTGTFDAAGSPGLHSIWADPLHDGPVPGGIGDDEVPTVRARFLSGSTRADEDVTDTVEELRQWRRAIIRT
jgi:hypothetical protein